MVSPARALLFALALAMGLSCASSSWVPRCEPGPRFAPTGECLAVPEARAMAAQLSALIDSETDPVAVLVGFGESGEVDSVCAAHTMAPKRWDGQRELNAMLPEILRIPAGGSCLAGSTLVFNKAGAALGGLRAELADCRSFQDGSTGLFDPLCLQNRQVRRGELWFFSTRRDYPYVFVPGDGAKGRGLALDRCTDFVGVMPTQLPETTIGFTRRLSQLSACMHKLGWRQVL